jgi:hypothetical protein
VSKILLDYVFPVSVITPTPQASTASLKQVCVVAKPKSGQESNVGKVFLCTSMTQVGVRTNNTEAQRLFDAGMSRVYILLSSDLDIAAAMDANAGKFFTVLISSDFADDDFDDDGAAAVAAARTVGDLTFTALPGAAGNDLSVELLNQTDAGEEVVHVIGDKISILMKGGTSTAQQIKDACENSVQFLATGVTVSIAAGHASTAQAAAAEADLTGGSAATAAGLLLGGFDGVVGVASSDDDFVAAQAAIEKRAAFHTTTANKAKNMFYAFGKLLSNQLNWLNQQFITMPVADDVDEAGEAESLFESKVSFVLSDDDYGNRLALFAVGGKAIIAPYIFKNLLIDLQSRTLQWIAANQPDYTKTEAALLEVRLQQDVIEDYITRKWLSGGQIEIKLVQQNFVAGGFIDVPEPKALWRVFSELRSTT